MVLQCFYKVLHCLNWIYLILLTLQPAWFPDSYTINFNFPDFSRNQFQNDKNFCNFWLICNFHFFLRNGWSFSVSTKHKIPFDLDFERNWRRSKAVKVSIFPGFFQILLDSGKNGQKWKKWTKVGKMDKSGQKAKASSFSCGNLKIQLFFNPQINF